MDRETRTDIAVLARLDLMQAAAIWRGVRREPLVIVAAIGAAAATLVAGARLAHAAQGDPPAALPAVAAASFVAFSLVHAGFRVGPAAATAEGPFGELVLRAGVRAAWLAGRTAASLAPFVVLTAIGAASAGCAAGLALSACAVAGIALAAAVHVLAALTPPSPDRVRHRSRRAERAVARSANLRPAAVLIAWLHLRRRVGGAPTWLAVSAWWTLAAFAGAVARQNGGVGMGAAVVAALALPGLALLARTDVPLIQTLGRERVGLARLIARFLGTAAIGAAGLFAVAVVAGLGVPIALGLAAACALGLGLSTIFLVLHALIRPGAAAPTAAAVDFAASLGLVLITPWAALWTLIRLPLLISAAERRRWLDT